MTYVECFTAAKPQTLREWRQTRGASTIVDLELAYLLLRVDEKLWKYKLVRYKGRTYTAYPGRDLGSI